MLILTNVSIRSTIVFQIMSFDRYLAVTKAFDSRKWLSSLRSATASYVISAVGWILSALLCVQLYRYSKITICNQCEYSFPQDLEEKNEPLTGIHVFDPDENQADLFNDYINYNPEIRNHHLIIKLANDFINGNRSNAGSNRSKEHYCP